MNSRRVPMISYAMPTPRAPSLQRVIMNQIRLIDRAKRIPLLIGLLVAAIGIGQVDAVYEPEALFPLWPLLFVAGCWPLFVWYGETPNRRHYHRSLPVDQVAHDLIKIGAGALYLTFAVTGVTAILLLLGWLTGFGWLIGSLSLLTWLNFLTGPLIVYLLFTPVPMLSNRPFEMTLVTAAALFGLTMITDLIRVSGGTLGNLLMNGSWGVLHAALGMHTRQPWNQLVFGSPYPTGQFAVFPHGAWVLSTMMWLVIGCTLVLAASYWVNRREA